MLCPCCQKKLDKAIFYNTEVDFCPVCLGVFFEEDELRQAKDERDKSLSWLDIDLWQDKTKFKISRGKLLCPACRLPLYDVYYGDSRIAVNVCNLCRGIWLDRGEFKRIIEYLKEEADWQILKKYGQNLAKELWEVFTGPETLKEEVSDFLIMLKMLNYKFSVQYPQIAKIISNLPR